MSHLKIKKKHSLLTRRATYNHSEVVTVRQLPISDGL